MKKILLALTLALVLLTSCWKSESVDIINPDAEYLYFFGATCPHCQELNRRAEEIDLFSKIKIEKREVYFNNENREMFLKLIEEINPERDGVPFVYDKTTGQVGVGVDPAFGILTNRLEDFSLESDVEVVELEEDTSKSETETMSGETTENETMTGSEEETSNTGTITE